jgi:hypothetical protein
MGAYIDYIVMCPASIEKQTDYVKLVKRLLTMVRVCLTK